MTVPYGFRVKQEGEITIVARRTDLPAWRGLKHERLVIRAFPSLSSFGRGSMHARTARKNGATYAIDWYHGYGDELPSIDVSFSPRKGVRVTRWTIEGAAIARILEVFLERTQPGVVLDD